MAEPGDDRAVVPGDHQPGPDHPRRPRPDQPAFAWAADRRAHGRRVRGHRGRWAHPARPGPGQGEPSDPRVRPAVPEARDDELGAWPAPAEAGALHLVADRAGPRPPRRRHRAGAAAEPSGRTDRLARAAPGDPRARGRSGERLHPASRWLASESAPHRGGVRRARPALLRGAAPDGRSARSTTSWSSTTWSGDEHYDLVVGDEAWDVDHFLARETRAQAVRLCLAHRLRRLPPDARTTTSAVGA